MPDPHSSETPVDASDEATAAEPEEQLESRARRGMVWVLLGYGGAQVLRLAGNLILTRLLFREAFGVMALLGTVLMGIELFSDIGIGPSIIQHKRRDAGFVNTAFTMQAGRGVAMYVIAAALALPLSWFYREPQLAHLLPLVGLSALFAGFNSTKIFTLNRDLALGRIEIVVIGSQALGLLVMVVWALLDRSVLALVAGSLTTSFSKMVLSHVFLPGERNRFRWDRAAVGDLVRFGRWIFLGTVLTFIAGQSDRLIFGKLVTLERLGVYYMGVVIATLPAEALSRLTMQVIFPVYAGVRERDGSFESVFESTRLTIMVASGWAFAGLIAGGQTAVDLLYDPRYADAGWAVQILAVGGWWLIVGNSYGAAYFAAGKPRWTSAGAFAKVLTMGAAIPLGYWLGAPFGYGFQGAVAGFSISEMMRYLVMTLASGSIGLSGWRRDVQFTSLVALSGLSGAALDWWMRSAGLHVALRAAVDAVYVTAWWVPLGLPILRRRLAARRG